MGNADSTIDPGPEIDDLDIPVTVQVVKKPSKSDAVNYNTTIQPLTIDTTGGESSSRTAKRRGSRENDSIDLSGIEADNNDDDIKPMELLLQFIPYYGQGDPSNDSTVRAALSALSVDEIDSRDEYGNTLLLLACQYRCEDLVRIMLNKGADPNAVNSSGACCLHFACYRESSSLIISKMLLQNGANPDVSETTYGCTPLHYCAGTGDIEFCKLLLSNNAHIETVDYYNYTCVDYAKEAGMAEVAGYLQNRLQKFNDESKLRKGHSSSFNVLGALSPDMRIIRGSYGEDWYPNIDPGSGAKYYVNAKTQETLWESDLTYRLQMAATATAAAQSSSSSESKPTAEPSGSSAGERRALIAQTLQSRLIAFLTMHDPARLVEVDALMQQYRGKETALLDDLCAKYTVDKDTELAAFKDKLKLLKIDYNTPQPSPEKKSSSQSSSFFASSGKATAAEEATTGLHSPHNASVRSMALAAVSLAPQAPGGVDPAMVQTLLNEARVKFEAQLEEERSQFRTNISEKEGLVSKLESQCDALRKEREEAQREAAMLSQRMERSQSQGGEALLQAEAMITHLEAEASALRDELNTKKQELSYEINKLKSLEATLSNLSSSNEEVLAREQQAAEDRAGAMKELEQRHASEVREQQEAQRSAEARHKADVNKITSDLKMHESAILASHDQYKREREIEFEKLTEQKAKLSQELSQANLLCEDLRKSVDEANRRAETAEAIQRSLQEEVVQSRQLQQFNTQLHKDLAREQLARKRLHNEMEDMKGRIRVYVRVRPFSTSEKEKSCQEAVYKDGKLSVQVKLPDGKKQYDFDQVFGGLEGNSQSDIFRDTKHLIMSVIDGYNVCIFAYGQTGAGKSFTMIGAADIGNCLTENGEFDELAGVTPRAVSELFRLLNERKAQIEFSVEVQMFQLYRDNIDDLCFERKRRKKGEEGVEDAPPQLKIKLAEHTASGLVEVEGATTNVAETPGDVMKIFAKGSSRRTTASTQMNSESSRSHLICCLVVRLKNRKSGKESVGKLTLVDLAGSERVDKSGATGEMLKEAQSINKSLSAIGDVIAALTSGQNHVPYRNHPLTMLMSDSIGGNAKTLMFVNTSPADYNSAESNSSLSFASRCKDITNSVSTGGGVQTAQMNALKKELAKLKKGGGKAGGAGGLTRPSGL